MEHKQIEQIALAILFASGDEIDIDSMAEAMDCDVGQLRQALESLANRMRYEQAGLQIIRVEDKVQLGTNPVFAEYIQKALAPSRSRPLSQSAMETLSIVAYRQPITRRDIEQIRGVNCDYVVQALQSRGLIAIVGHSDAVGHPRLWGTTAEFLRCFHLESIQDLPNLDEFAPPADTADGADTPDQLTFFEATE